MKEKSDFFTAAAPAIMKTHLFINFKRCCIQKFERKNLIERKILITNS